MYFQLTHVSFSLYILGFVQGELAYSNVVLEHGLTRSRSLATPKPASGIDVPILTTTLGYG